MNTRDDYWETFVLKHRHPGNIAFHWVSFFVFYGLPLYALCTRQWWLMIFWPLSSLIGLMGHLLFEKNQIDFKDTIFTFRTIRCLNRMFFRLIVGKYQEDIRLITGKYTSRITQA